MHYLLCTFMLLQACVQKNSDYYNLNFQKQFVDGWATELIMGRIYYDSTMVIGGNTSICIDNEYIIRPGNQKLRRFVLNYSLGREISLPELKEEGEIEVSVKYKSQNLDQAWLRVYTADKNGKSLHEYSEEMPDKNQWTKVKIQIPNNQVQHLYVNVYTLSNNLISKMSKLFIEKNIPLNLDSSWMHFPVQKLWIDKVEIKAGDFDMADFKPEMMPKPEIMSNIPVPLDLNSANPFAQVNELKDKKIIGIGESAHGTKEFPKIGYALIKDRILHHNCKLVVLEIPFFLGLKLNLFVNRETSFDIKEVEKSIRYCLIDFDEVRDFLLWLKNYNETAGTKVKITGTGAMDILAGQHFLSFVNEYVSVDSQLFTPVYQDVLEKKSPEEIYNRFMKNRGRFEIILGTGEARLLMYGLKHALQIPPAGAEMKFLLTGRDSIMYNIAQTALDYFLQNEDETAVFYAHLYHTSKSEACMHRFVSSTGKYLSDNYDDDYFSIGLLSYSEQLNPNQNNTVMAFTPAPSYSLEAAFEKTGVPLFYTSVRGLPSTVLLRNSGANMFKGTFDYFPTKGMDAFIFVDRVHKGNVRQF